MPIVLPPKETRTEIRQRQTRVGLREAAYRLMSASGVDRTTIQEITDAADIGFGTFYNYYASKDDLAQDVLDCLIHNIGQRNDLVTELLDETDPVRVVANSVRFVIHVIASEPMFGWWVAHLDLLADRMGIGFAPFGLRDIDRAVAAGAYHLIGDDRKLAWSQLVWLMAAGGRDIARGVHPPEAERSIVEGILRVMGVDSTAAHLAVAPDLAPTPVLTVDFSYDMQG